MNGEMIVLVYQRRHQAMKKPKGKETKLEV